MLDQLSYQITDEGIKIGVFGDAAPRADGHNNLSGRSELPLRRFLPAEGELFRDGIMREVERILADAAPEEISEDDFEQSFAGVSTSSELYDRLGALFNLTSRSEIRRAVFRSPRVFNLVGLFGLSDLL